MAGPKGNTYVVKLHRWVQYWDKRFRKVNWAKLPKAPPKGGGGGQGGSPPPPNWPP